MLFHVLGGFVQEILVQHIWTDINDSLLFVHLSARY